MALRLALVAGATLMALVGAELVLRAAAKEASAGGAGAVAPRAGATAYEHHPVLGWAPRPRARLVERTPEFSMPVRIGRRGFRSDREVTPLPLPGITRVVAIGDSFTFGQGVAAGDAFPGLLDGWLDTTEVLNLGVPGYCVGQQLLMLRERGLPLRPHVVLHGLHVRDVFRSLAARREKWSKPYFELDGDDRLVLRNVPVPLAPSPVERRGLDRLLLVRTLRAKLMYRGLGPAWPLNAALLAAIAEESARAEASLLVVLIPAREAVHGDTVERLLQGQTMTRLARSARRAGVPYVDVTPALRAQAAGGPLYFPIDGHLTPAGHQVVAAAVRQHLERLVAVAIAERAAQTAAAASDAGTPARTSTSS